MSMLLRRKTKPVDLPAEVVSCLAVLRDEGAKAKKREGARESLASALEALRECLYGLSGLDEDAVRGVRKELLASDMVASVLGSFGLLEVEGRRLFKDVFASLLHKDTPPGPMVQYLLARPELLLGLVDAVAANSEPSATLLLFLDMLRSAFQAGPLVDVVLRSERLWALFACVALPDFAVSASAFNALRDLLLGFPDALLRAVAGHGKNTQLFVEHSARLLQVGSASQKRKSLELLSQILSSNGANQLLLDVAAAVPLATALLPLLLSKGATGEKTAAFLGLLAPHATPEVRAVFGGDEAVAALREAKADDVAAVMAKK